MADANNLTTYASGNLDKINKAIREQTGEDSPAPPAPAASVTQTAPTQEKHASAEYKPGLVALALVHPKEALQQVEDSVLTGKYVPDIVLNATKPLAEGIFHGIEKATGHALGQESKPEHVATAHAPAGNTAQVEQHGLTELRKGLGADAAAMSDAELKSTVGPEILGQIGHKGFPQQEVAGIQKEFSDMKMDKVTALQTYVEACNSKPGEKIEFTDDKGKVVSSLSADKVLAAAGIERSDISKAQNHDPAQAKEQTQKKEAAQMAMS